MNYLPVSAAATALRKLVDDLGVAQRDGTLRGCADVLAKISRLAEDTETLCNNEIFRGTKVRT